MKEQKRIDLGLTGLDELFMNDAGRAENRRPKTQEIDISLIDSFENHPFKVQKDDDMEQLIESIRERGIIIPVIVRPKEDGRYELISGHRRTFACKELGITTIKAEVKDINRDEATILMVDSNLQRSTILPSEKAFSYRMRLEAMKRQGQRTDLTSSPLGMKLDGKQTLDIIGEKVGDSKTQVHRYIRLTYLIPELLNLVDEGRIALRPAVELSYISPEHQKKIYEIFLLKDITPSYTQAIALNKHAQNDKLTDKIISDILSVQKPNQKEKFSLNADSVRKYVPSGFTTREAEQYIIKALEYYSRYRNQNKDRDR